MESLQKIGLDPNTSTTVVGIPEIASSFGTFCFKIRGSKVSCGQHLFQREMIPIGPVGPRETIVSDFGLQRSLWVRFGGQE